MFHRPPRLLSQRNHKILQEIRENAARLRQIDAGLGYRRNAVEHSRGGEERPLHIGPQIEAIPVDGEWAA